MLLRLTLLLYFLFFASARIQLRFSIHLVFNPFTLHPARTHIYSVTVHKGGLVLPLCFRPTFTIRYGLGAMIQHHMWFPSHWRPVPAAFFHSDSEYL